MINIIKVFYKNEKHDLKGIAFLDEIKKTRSLRQLSSKIKKIKTVRVYRLEGISKKQTHFLANKLFCESINQKFKINDLKSNKKRVEIAYKPGVMNPESASIIKSAKDLKIHLKAADSSWEYEFQGNITKKEIMYLSEKLKLYNPIVENIIESSPKTLIIKGKVGKTLIIPIRSMSDEDLMRISEDKLFLSLEEIKVIKNYFVSIKRDPTDVELETIAQTWSEHCAHKTFKANLIVDGKKKLSLITRIKKEALKHKKNIVSAFVDNSGVMDFYDGFAICGKAETHNSPSAIEPYGGAMTGSGGVFRDVAATGLGAKTIASTDIFCFANPDMDLSKLPSGCLPPSYLLKRCVQAVKDYGNRVGIPTNNGSFHFHDDFRAKPTVLVGAYGILPKKHAQKGIPRSGDLAIAIGGRTGRDGIHGATFSSGEMTNRTTSVNSSAVQIGNAIEEKRTFDAILEARDNNCIRAIQDCGAGGFSSAFGEMGEATGITIRLEKALLKYEGLSPWEIWISESQERMAVCVPKEKEIKFKDICKKHNVEISMLGKFDTSKRLNIFYKKEKVCELSMNFLHHGLPQRTMKATKSKNHLRGAFLVTSEVAVGLLRGGSNKMQKEWIDTIKQVLSHGNISSKEPIVRLYDHTVQGTNALQPFTGAKNDGPNNAAILSPILDKPYAMVISHGLNPLLNNIDPYWGSIWAGVEALSNYAAVGGDYKHASLINNYIWPFPDKESLWSLDRSVDAVVDFMKVFKIPVISGKDSLSSTYRGADGKIIKIPPVLCISVFGKIKDSSKTISSDLKKENSVICLLGNLDANSMGGSVYFEILKKKSDVPRPQLQVLPLIFDSLFNAIQKEEILSCHDISEGGLITSLFEMCVGGNMGVKINIPMHLGRWQGNDLDSSEVKYRPDNFLFNETPGTFLVEVENTKTAEKIFKNIPFVILGKTKKEKTIKVNNNHQLLFEANLEDLKKTWQEPMKKFF